MDGLPQNTSQTKPVSSVDAQNSAVTSDSVQTLAKQTSESLVPEPYLGDTPQPRGAPPVEYGEYMQKQQEIELLKQQKLQRDDLLKQLHQKTRELEDLNQQAKLLQNTPVSTVNTNNENTLTNQTGVTSHGSMGDGTKDPSLVSGGNSHPVEGYQAPIHKINRDNVQPKQPGSSSDIQVKVEPKYDLNKSVPDGMEPYFETDTDSKSKINNDSSEVVCKLNCVLCEECFSNVLDLESHVQTHAEVLHFSLLLKEAVSKKCLNKFMIEDLKPCNL